MKYILSSAVCPCPGTYEYQKIDESQALKWLNDSPDAVSGIQYPETARAFEMLFRKEIKTGRHLTLMSPGDEALVLRLTKRIPPEFKYKIPAEFVLKNREIGLLKRIK